MTNERPKALSIRHKGSSQFLRNVVSRWPVLVWLGVAVFAWQLHRKGTRFDRINGTIFADTESVSPLEDGVLKTIEVKVGDRVSAGQTVATMDDTLILAEIEDYERSYELERLERLRRFQSAYTSAADELAKILAEQKASTEQAGILESRLTTMKQANTERPGTYLQADIDGVEFDYLTLKALVESFADRITNLTDSRDSAKSQWEEIQRLDKNAGAEKSAALGILRERLKAKTLTAHQAGTVATIRHKPGAVVRRGDPMFPVMTIVTDEGVRARGFILEEDAAKVKVGDPVTVVPASDRANIHQGEILALAPQIIGVPDAASTVNNRLVQGREVEVTLDNSQGLIPGQSVIIEVGEPKKFDWWSFGFRRKE